MNKYFNMDKVKAVDEDKQIIEMVASKEQRDFDNDIVVIDGIDLSKIKKNGPLLWSHNQGELPIGKLLRVWKDGKELKARAQFASAEANPLAPSVFKLIQEECLKNVSISFLPDWDSIEYKEDKKTGKRTQVIHKSTLLEISIVAIGANPGTSISVKGFKGIIEDGWEKGVLDGTELNDLEEALDKIEETTHTEEIDYQKQIDDLKAEMEELKNGSYLYSMFDKSTEDKEENSIDKLYDTIIQEKEEKDEYYQEMIDELKDIK